MFKKKIIITYEHGLGSDTIGGGQRILLEIINELKDFNDITLLTPKISSNDFIQIKNVNIQYTLFSKISFINGIYIFFKFIKYKHYKCDVVISFTSELYFISLVKRFFNFKLASYLAAPDLDGFELNTSVNKIKTIRKRFELYLFLLGFKRADIKLAIGEKIKNEYIQKFGKTNVEVVYPGVKFSMLSRLANKKKDLINILYIGRLDFKQKPLYELILALSESTDYFNQFHVIGNGPDMELLMDLKNNHLKEKICIHGNLMLEDSYEILNVIDLVILPSINESFMLTVYEMIALGFVTIYNDVADLKRNLSNVSTAFCVENKSINYIYYIKNFKNIILNTSDINSSSRFVAENFNWKKLADKLIGN